MKRRIFTAMLAVIIGFCSLPETAYALDFFKLPGGLPDKVEKGDIISFGTYEQDNFLFLRSEKIEWQVLTVKKGKALCISRYALDRQRFHDHDEDVTWETSELRRWLNNSFYNTAFSETEKEKIATTTVLAQDNEDFHMDAGKETRDKVFLLSLTEIEKYFSSREELRCLPTEFDRDMNDRMADENGTAWWTRTPGHDQKTAAVVLSDGFVWSYGDGTMETVYHVRPAVWIRVGKNSPDTPDEGEPEKEAGTAASQAPEAESTAVDTSLRNDYQVGDTVVLGQYEQDGKTENGTESIQWIIVHKEGNEATLLSKYILDNMPYHSGSYPDGGVSWENSSIRSWLNGTFYQDAFDEDEKKEVLTTEVYEHINPRSDYHAGKTTRDRVFFLSLPEVTTYVKEVDVLSVLPTGYALAQGVTTDPVYRDHAGWWLRTTSDIVPRLEKAEASFVAADSHVDYSGADVMKTSMGVRPAVRVDLSKADLPIRERREDRENAGDQHVENIMDLSLQDLYTGDLVSFGTYEQDNKEENGKEEIRWIVVSLLDNGSVLLLSEKLLDCQRYYLPGTTDTSGVTWQDTGLRRWLNEDFLNEAFSEEDRLHLKNIRVGGEYTDRVTLLSPSEFPEALMNSDIMKAVPTDALSYREEPETDIYFGSARWQLRPKDHLDKKVYAVYTDGTLLTDSSYNWDKEVFVRPAIVVDLGY